MYCNRCGKELPAESLFCPYCGEKQEAIVSHGNDNTVTTDEQKKDEKSIQSTQTNDKTKANSVADEIIANLKMIGLAILLCALYIGVFWICHIKDRKPVQENYYGYSCYDPVMMISDEKDWEKIYHKLSTQRMSEEIWLLNIGGYKLSDLDSSAKARKLMDDIRNSTPSDEELKIRAKKRAEENLNAFYEEINNTRKWQASDDLKTHLKYSIIISLALTIVGRYLIKGIKWVVHNKS